VLDPVGGTIRRDELDPALRHQLDPVAEARRGRQGAAEARLAGIVAVDVGVVERRHADLEAGFDERADAGGVDVPVGEPPEPGGDARDLGPPSVSAILGILSMMPPSRAEIGDWNHSRAPARS